jgi:ABC-type glycerol-3-phosphate transport system substrate-binding protein
MGKADFTRREVLRTTALATAGVIAAPYVRGAYAAGTVSVGFWDHWVPGANGTLTALCQEWGAKEKVDVKIDYITSQGNKNLLTIAAEAQAKSGHDILAYPSWQPNDKAELLEPVDDVMGDLIKQNGKVNSTVEYLARAGGKWIAVPATPGSQMKPPCSRIDLLKQHAGLDVQAMYPAGGPPKADAWTWDTFLAAAEKCAKAGFPFGLPLGETTDAVDWVGALFQSYGATLIDGKGTITVKSDATRQVLEFSKKLVAFLPPDVFAWDDASNNKWLIAGKGALIMNPPSAWAVAKRDAPQVAEQCWTHGMPAGPKGRYAPFLPYFWGIWGFSQNKSASKSLIRHLSTPAAIEKLVAASQGYDLPSYANLISFKTWAEEGPPKGTLFHYPNPYNHQIQSIAAAPAPPKIANQIYVQATMTKMIAKSTQGGESIEKTIAWAADELEGFSRT